MSVIAMSIIGPTASGKSSLAMNLARANPQLELVSVDSMQVYRGMDIGTAKPSLRDQAEIPHHLIDLVEAYDDYTVSRFQVDVATALSEIASRGHQAVMVGGTGLYLRAAIDQLEIPARYPNIRAELDAEPDTNVLYRQLVASDPVAADRMEAENRRRILRALEVTVGSGRPFSSFGPGLKTYDALDFPIVGLRLDRSMLDQRIADRLAAQLDAGFLDEVRGLVDQPEGMSRTARQALGYRELLSHLAGLISLADASDEIAMRTRRFARRQERWFRRDPRITWIDADSDALGDLTTMLGY